MSKTTAKKIDDARWVKDKAVTYGFESCYLTKAHLPPQIAERLHAFIAAGHQGEMTWMDETKARRISPDAMWDEAQTAIVLGMNYGPDHDPMVNLSQRASGNISVYARGRDYHEVIKGKLKQLASQIVGKYDVKVKVFVDTAPLMEKPLAAQSGLGWQGKHTNLVSRDFGSWLFLGVILTDAIFPEDAPIQDHCGSCTSCLDICPTKAFPAPYQLDARRCISYMTIEQKSQIAPEFREAIGNRIFGCDDCLAVCPWNKFAQAASELKLHAKHDPAMVPLGDLLQFDEGAFRAHFANMPVRRAGFERFMRNVLIAAGNAEDIGLIPFITPHLRSEMPLVQSMAIWALSRLVSVRELAAFYTASDNDMVRLEWKRALGELPQ